MSLVPCLASLISLSFFLIWYIGHNINARLSRPRETHATAFERIEDRILEYLREAERPVDTVFQPELHWPICALLASIAAISVLAVNLFNTRTDLDIENLVELASWVSSLVYSLLKLR